LDSQWTTTNAYSKTGEMHWKEATRRKRRDPSPEFKAKVALAAIQGDMTMAETRQFESVTTGNHKQKKMPVIVVRKPDYLLLSMRNMERLTPA